MYAYGHRRNEAVSDRGFPRTAWASSRAKACQCRLVPFALPGGKDTVFQGKPGEKSLVRFRCAHIGYTINISMARD